MEAKGCPTRRPTTRPLRRALAAATLTACSGTLDKTEVERSVASQFHDDRLEELGAASYVARCPREIPDTPGYLFQCSITGFRPHAASLTASARAMISEKATALVQVLDSGQVHILDS